MLVKIIFIVILIWTIFLSTWASMNMEYTIENKDEHKGDKK